MGRATWGGWTCWPLTAPTHLTSVKFLAFWVNVFHIENILEQDARHREGHESCRGAGRAATTGYSRSPFTWRKEDRAEDRPKSGNGAEGACAEPAATQPLPLPPSPGFFTSAGKDHLGAARALWASLQAR